MQQISDQEWFEANLFPALYRAKLGVPIPDLPPKDVQERFTGRSGRQNLQHAFDFYQFVLERMPKLPVHEYNVLDFGGGWGRIIRFFLREFEPERLIMADCLTDAITTARQLNAPFNIIHSAVNPPLPLESGSVGLCYAFSVFSHLAEKQASDWITHFSELMLPGGKLFLTTRGGAQIAYLETLVQAGTSNQLLSSLPSPARIKEEYQKGEFQFYPAGGGGELTDDFYGEAWIPRKWMEERYRLFGFTECEFYPEFKTVDQCVFVLTR